MNSEAHWSNIAMGATCCHDCAGRKTRYPYLAETEWKGKEPVCVGLAKVDLQELDKASSVVKSLKYGKDIAGGEAFFVPCHPNPADCDGKV